MATLESYQCKGCGSPLDRDSLKQCPYCGSANFIKAEVNPLKMNQEMAQKYVNFFQQKSKENPKDTNSLFAMGLLYLGLKNYELAQRNFKEAIDLSPMEADMYYYYALSLLGGKSPRTLDHKEITRIEEYLNSAINMEKKCKYIALLMAVKEEYYVGNGLKIPGESPLDLFEKAKEYSPDDIDEIQTHVLLRDQNTIDCINEIAGIEPEETEDEENDDDEDVTNNEEDDEDEDDEDEEYVELDQGQRYDYFRYRYEPVKPGNNDNPIPHYPVVRTIWKFALMLVYTFIIFIILNITGLGFKSNEIALNPVPVSEKFDKLKTESAHKLSKKERQELFTKLTNDSIEKARKDSSFNSGYITIFTRIKGESEHFLGVKKDKMSFVWIIVLFLPLIFWLFKNIKLYTSISGQRKFIKNEYDQDLQGFNTKPTENQMKMFIENYLSDIVDIELNYYKIDEDDLKGKILFVNYYIPAEEDDPEQYEGSGIGYTVALLEETKVIVLSSMWRIYEKNPEKGASQSIFYSDIKSVKLTGDRLMFGDISIKIPDESIFEYQNDDPDDELTFSNDRTSDAREFKTALDKLVNSYKNK